MNATSDERHDLVARLLPDQVAVVEGLIESGPHLLWPEEAAGIAHAVSKRQAEFACGRRLAREAFRMLGASEQALLPDKDRVPIWPSGLTGSITHSDHYCAVAVARSAEISAIGIDIEEAHRFRPELARYILSRREIEINLDGLSSPHWLLRATALFSAKESLYKCLYPRMRMPLAFHEVEVEFDPGAACFQARLLVQRGRFAAGQIFAGQYAMDSDRVAAAILIPAAAEPIE